MRNTLDVPDLERQPPVADSGTNRRPAILMSALLWDSLSYFGSKVVPGFMGLLSVPVFIRMIGLDEYGRFAVIVPLLMAVAGASSGWLAQGVLRFHPLTTDSRTRQVAFDRAVTRGTIASVLVTSAVLAAVLAGLHYPLRTSLISVAFCFALLIYTVTLSKFQAKLQPGSVLRREVVRSIGGFVFPIVLIAVTGRKQFEFLLLGQAVAYTIALLPNRRSPASTNDNAADAVLPSDASTGAVIRTLWRFGWAVALWLLLSQMLPVIDRWVILRFTSYTSAGMYASLYEIVIRSFSFLIFPLTQAAHPRIMRSWNEGQFAASYRTIRHSILTQFVIFIAVLGGVSVFAHRISKAIQGFDDPVAARMLPVLLVGGFLWQVALLLHKPLEIAQKTGVMLATMAAVVLVNAVACFLFIPRFGYQAACYIVAFSAFSYSAVTLCMTRFRALRGISPEAETC